MVSIVVIASSKTYESNFTDHDFVQFGKHHSRCKVILPSMVLSQQCCEPGCGNGSWKRFFFCGSGSAKILPLPFLHRSGILKLTLPMYSFSISIDEHVPLKFLMTKRLGKITDTYLPTSI